MDAPVINRPFDPWDVAHRPHPHALYQQMREAAPVYRGIGPETKRSFWFLTRYEDVVGALRDPRLGREWRKLPEGLRLQHSLPGDEDLEMVQRHLLSTDPPDHTRLRRLVSSAFTEKRIRELEPRIHEITARLLDAIHDPGRFDLIDDLALPLPLTLIAEVLGVPIGDQGRFRDMVDRVLRAEDPKQAVVAGGEMIEYVNAAIDARKAKPGDDLLSALIYAQENGDHLDRSELLSMVQLLLIAGYETTVNLIGNGMLELVTHPEQQKRLASQPALLESAVEEMLRFNGPAETTFQIFSYEDVEIRGTLIPAGDLVVPVLLAANRDPAQFPDPDHFDVQRQPNKHVAFGTGIHNCLGAPLARLEAKAAIGALLQRWPQLSLVGDREELEWNRGLLIRGVRRLPLSA